MADQNSRHQGVGRSTRANDESDDGFQSAECAEELLRAFKLPKIAELISYKRLSWVGHAVRRGENDRSRMAVLKALTNKKSKWSKSVRKDFEDRQMDIREVLIWQAIDHLGKNQLFMRRMLDSGRTREPGRCVFMCL